MTLMVILNPYLSKTKADWPPVQLRAIISNLFVLIVQAHEYQGPATQNGMSDEMYRLQSRRRCHITHNRLQ